jgi:hypothetical protein
MLHRLRQSRTLHTLTAGPKFGVHFIKAIPLNPGGVLILIVAQSLEKILKLGSAILDLQANVFSLFLS